MRELLRITALLAVSVVAIAQQTGVHADSNPSTEAEVKALVSKMAELIVRGDWDEYAKHLASDCLHTGYDGRVENKDQAMASLRDPQRKIIVMEQEAEELRVRVYGDTAVANAELTIAVRESGRLKSPRIRVTDTFLKRDGQWLLIADQGTPIGK